MGPGTARDQGKDGHGRRNRRLLSPSLGGFPGAGGPRISSPVPRVFCMELFGDLGGPRPSDWAWTVMIYFPPSNLQDVENAKFINAMGRESRIFLLAGASEMDSSSRWQETVASFISKAGHIALCSRLQDSKLSTSSFENAHFFQVRSWELDALELAEFVVFHLDASSKSPEGILELGYAAAKFPKKVCVICPEGFWCKGLVDILCYREDLMKYKSVEEMLDALNQMIMRGHL